MADIDLFIPQGMLSGTDIPHFLLLGFSDPGAVSAGVIIGGANPTNYRTDEVTLYDTRGMQSYPTRDMKDYDQRNMPSYRTREIRKYD